MKLHVLPGDAVADRFRMAGIDGEVAICREALIDGPVSNPDLDVFWDERAEFIADAYGGSEDSYRKDVVPEFLKIANIPWASEVNLWFEYELFCSVNMWFCLHLLSGKDAEVYRVAPIVHHESEIWKGFGPLGPNDLRDCFDARRKLSPDEVALGAELWEAYANSDNEKLLQTASRASDSFPYVEEVCAAASQMNTRPKQVLNEIISSGISDFQKIFEEFSIRAGEYGFGDAQVRRLLDLV